METLNNTTTENKITWTKKLNNFRDYDKERIYYYRKKVKDDEYDRVLLKDYHCVNCKGELNIFKNEGEYEYRYEPYRIHKVFLKSQWVNHPSTWHRGEKLEVSYYNAICCKCWEKTYKNKCDCLEYLNGEIRKQELEIKKDEARIEVFKNVCAELTKDINFFKEQNKQNEVYTLQRYLEESEKIINDYLENINHEKEQLKKSNWQVEQVKQLLRKI